MHPAMIPRLIPWQFEFGHEDFAPALVAFDFVIGKQPARIHAPAWAHDPITFGVDRLAPALHFCTVLSQASTSSAMARVILVVESTLCASSKYFFRSSCPTFFLPASANTPRRSDSEIYPASEISARFCATASAFAFGPVGLPLPRGARSPDSSGSSPVGICSKRNQKYLS